MSLTRSVAFGCALLLVAPCWIGFADVLTDAVACCRDEWVGGSILMPQHLKQGLCGLSICNPGVWSSLLIASRGFCLGALGSTIP